MTPPAPWQSRWLRHLMQRDQRSALPLLDPLSTSPCCSRGLSHFLLRRLPLCTIIRRYLRILHPLALPLISLPAPERPLRMATPHSIATMRSETSPASSSMATLPLGQAAVLHPRPIPPAHGGSGASPMTRFRVCSRPRIPNPGLLVTLMTRTVIWCKRLHPRRTRLVQPPRRSATVMTLSTG